MIKDSFPAVWIEWNDAYSSQGWHSLERVNDFVCNGTMPVKTLGWLVGETDEHYSIAMSVSPTLASELLNIPKGWVNEFRRLSE